MWFHLHSLLLLSVSLTIPSSHAAAHYTGYPHGSGGDPPSTSVGLDIVLGVEDAEPSDGADYHEFLNSLNSKRPMVPFRWYPYVPGRPGSGGGGYYKPSRWPEEGGGGYGGSEDGRKPTVLYLEGDDVPGAEGRPGRPELLPDPEERPDRPNRPDSLHRPDASYRPDRPDYLDRPKRPQRPLSPPAEAFICPDQHSCSDSVWDRRDTRRSLSWDDRGCFCDAECARYGDCCRDAPALREDQGEEEQEEDKEDKKGKDGKDGGDKEAQLKPRAAREEEGTRESKKEQEKFECRPVPVFSSISSSPADKEQTWYMMSACPRDFDGYDNKVRCEVPSPAPEDPLSALPVTSGVTNITYSSLFCAMCHNDTTDLTLWQLGLRCPDITAHSPTERQLLDRLRRTPSGWGLMLDSGRVFHCEMTARPPAAARQCRALYDRCPRSSPLHEACKNHTAAVYIAGRAFRNVYCALCAGGRPSQIRCSAPCESPERPADIGGVRMRLSITPGADDRCGETEIHDPFSRRCRSTVCSRLGFSLVDGACVRTAEDDPEDPDEDQEGRERRGEEAELTDPDDNLLPGPGLVDADNAIEVELIDALRPTLAEDEVQEGEETVEVEEPQPLNATEEENEAEEEDNGEEEDQESESSGVEAEAVGEEAREAEADL